MLDEPVEFTLVDVERLLVFRGEDSTTEKFRNFFFLNLEMSHQSTICIVVPSVSLFIEQLVEFKSAPASSICLLQEEEESPLVAIREVSSSPSSKKHIQQNFNKIIFMYRIQIFWRTHLY